MKKHKQITQKRTKKLLTIAVIVGIVVAFDLTVSGFLKFGYYVVKCGGVPVALTPGGFMAGGGM